MQIIAFQPELCPALPTVVENVDYRDIKATLERIDQLLRYGGVESAFVRHCLLGCPASPPAIHPLRGGRIASEWVAEFNRNGWPISVGMGGRFASESVADFGRNTQRAPEVH
jgi:hypothetical protein